MPARTDVSTCDIPDGLVPRSRLVAASSYLIDRYVPDCEIIDLPEKSVAGGRLRFGLEMDVTRPAQGGGRAGILRRRPGTQTVTDRPVFDFRLRTPQNWAHFLNNHLPLFFHITSRLGLDWGAPLILVPANIPAYIRAAAEIFGLTLMATDDAVQCDCVAFAMEPWTGLRPARADWVHVFSQG